MNNEFIIETLEEAAERYLESKNWRNLGSFNQLQNIFTEGAKYQAERMYSEEEVGELVYNIIGEYGKYYGIMIDGAKLNELFEKFKK